jgi:hypothetical protein
MSLCIVTLNVNGIAVVRVEKRKLISCVYKKHNEYKETYYLQINSERSQCGTHLIQVTTIKHNYIYKYDNNIQSNLPIRSLLLSSHLY